MADDKGANPGGFWMARMETRNTESVAFGNTAAKALEGLVEAWIGKYCPLTDADPALPWENREDIKMVRGDLGQGYVLGPTDQAWFPEALHGDHPSLAETWDALAERHAIVTGPRP